MKMIFIHAILSYAICNVLIFGSIFTWFRNLMERLSPNENYGLYKLFTCMMCLPLYVGLLLSYLGLSIFSGVFTNITLFGFDITKYFIYLIDGLYTSGIVWLIHTTQEKLEK